MTTTYYLNGNVLGNLWGGGTGAYPSIELKGDNLDKLISEANALLKTGGLDSGMGFESLIGAVFTVTVKSKQIIDGKPWINVEDFDKYLCNKQISSSFNARILNKGINGICIGELTDSQEDFLMSCSFN